MHTQDAAIGVQLAHAGRKASTYRGFPGEPQGSVPPDAGGWTTIGPSAEAFVGYTEPVELSSAEISEVVAAFAESARRADEAGFDVVEIHAAHGYLIHQFLSPLSNHRTDAYGGDFAGRTRLALEVAEAVRAVWPQEKPLFVRISATDWTEGGWDADQSVRLAAALRERGVDLVDTSTGGNVLAEIPVGPGYQVPFARQIREQAQIPTGAVGLILEPQQAEKILADGDADVVLLARAALREPSWPQRAAAELGLSWRDAPYPPAYVRGRWDDVPVCDPAGPADTARTPSGGRAGRLLACGETIHRPCSKENRMVPSAPVRTATEPDWTARLISPDDDFAGAPLLRTEFALEDGHGADQLGGPARHGARGVPGVPERRPGR